MKKRIYSILLVCLLAFALTGCAASDVTRKIMEKGVGEEKAEDGYSEETEAEEKEGNAVGGDKKDGENTDKTKEETADKSKDGLKDKTDSRLTDDKNGKTDAQKNDKGEEISGDQEDGKTGEDDFSDIHLDLDNLEYSCNRDDFPSDIAFANFRHLSGGAINESMFYRSVSPIFNQYNRAPYADALAREAGINCVLNLSDSKTEMQTFLDENGHISPYYEKLLGENKVIPLNLSSDYHKNSFAFSLAEGLRKMLQMEGPVLIHCIEGKDRTGFVCLLLEGMAGASYDEVVADYMITFDNYLGINQESNPRYYQYIKQEEVDTLIRYIALEDEDVDASQIDIHKAARQYLYNAGLTEDELNKLEERVRQ